jgi:hypothetical protein
MISTWKTSRIDFDSEKGETFNRPPALAYFSRNLSRRPGPPQAVQDTEDARVTGRRLPAMKPVGNPHA